MITATVAGYTHSFDSGNAGITIDDDNGSIKFDDASLVTQTTTHILTVAITATNNNDSDITTSEQVVITINVQALSLPVPDSAVTFAAGGGGVFVTVTASNGTTPYTYEIVDIPNSNMGGVTINTSNGEVGFAVPNELASPPVEGYYIQGDQPLAIAVAVEDDGTKVTSMLTLNITNRVRIKDDKFTYTGVSAGTDSTVLHIASIVYTFNNSELSGLDVGNRTYIVSAADELTLSTLHSFRFKADATRAAGQSYTLVYDTRHDEGNNGIIDAEDFAKERFSITVVVAS